MTIMQASVHRSWTENELRSALLWKSIKALLSVFARVPPAASHVTPLTRGRSSFSGCGRLDCWYFCASKKEVEIFRHGKPMAAWTLCDHNVGYTCKRDYYCIQMAGWGRNGESWTGKGCGAYEPETVLSGVSR